MRPGGQQEHRDPLPTQRVPGGPRAGSIFTSELRWQEALRGPADTAPGWLGCGAGGRGLREGMGALQPGGFPSSSWRLLPPPTQKGAQPVRSGCHWGRHVLFLTLPMQRAGVWQLIAAPPGGGERRQEKEGRGRERPPPASQPGPRLCTQERWGSHHWPGAGACRQPSDRPPGLRQGATARGRVWDPAGQHMHTWVCVPRSA